VRKTVDSVVAKYRNEQSAKQSNYFNANSYKTFAGIAAAMAVTLAVWLFWPAEQYEPGVDNAGSLSSSDIIGSGFAMVSGQVFAGSQRADLNRPVAAGRPIRTTQGRAVINLPFGIAISVSEGTTLKLSETGSGKLVVDLIFGTALFAVDPDIKRPGLLIKTQYGKVEVTGTVFEIECMNKSETIHLLKGTLAVVEKDGTEREIFKGESITLGEPGVESISDSVKDVMLSKVDELWHLKLGGNLLPLLKPGVDDAALEADSASVNSSASVTTVNKDESDNIHTAPTLKALMKKARHNKLDGNLNDAIRTYEEIVRRFPAANDAQTSRILLGQLYLDKLNRPGRALKNFSNYLKVNSSGALTQEALYGKAKAQRALKQRDAELLTLQKLLQQYPDGVFSGPVKKRIRQIR
jgi:hypothetical protein